MYDRRRIAQLMTLLGGAEAPLGIFFTDREPQEGETAAPGAKSDCIMNVIRAAREKKTQAWFAADRTGCPGGDAYLGFNLPAPDFLSHRLSTGILGKEGERYLPSTASADHFWDDLDIRPAPATHFVIKPLNLFTGGEEPLFVVFFARVEELAGLCNLARFALDSHDAVTVPYGAGCSCLFAWPDHYRRKSLEKAVLGCLDPSCRHFMEMDELSLTVSAATFGKMLAAMDQTFLLKDGWKKVVAKIKTRHRHTRPDSTRQNQST